MLSEMLGMLMSLRGYEWIAQSDAKFAGKVPNFSEGSLHRE